MTATETSSRGRIVVGVDGSPPSVDALRWAARIATAISVEIDAVTSWEYPTSYGMGAAPSDWRPDIDATQLLADALSGAFGDTKPDGLRAMVRQGHPAQVLLDASNDAEMLVVGSRGHGGFIGLLLGSVSAYCAEHATCPVVVTRTRADTAQQ